MADVAPVPEQAITDEARVAAAGAIWDLIGAGNLPIDRGQLADRFATAALEAAVPAICAAERACIRQQLNAIASEWEATAAYMPHMDRGYAADTLRRLLGETKEAMS